MSTKSEIQSLLRFLTQDAKIPLALALSRTKELQAANLTSPETFARTTVSTLDPIFPDPKQIRQILAAAKRITKKRSSPSDASTSSPSKRQKPLPSPSDHAPINSKIELALALPSSVCDESDLISTILYTNRAPLVLAFAVILLKYTLPSQPLSSRLSIAQAVVSANSKQKAISLGIEKGKLAEDEGWGAGQPSVRAMGRDIKVMRRWGYEWESSELPPQSGSPDNIVKAETTEHQEGKEEGNTQCTLKQGSKEKEEGEPPLWALDLSALRASNTFHPPTSTTPHPTNSALPIYHARPARSYLLKSFFPPPSPPSPQKKTFLARRRENEKNLSRLLCALEMLFSSWSGVLDAAELDRRAWTWYVAVRPEVREGVKGWGEKGEVRLESILKLRRM